GRLRGRPGAKRVNKEGRPRQRHYTRHQHSNFTETLKGSELQTDVWQDGASDPEDKQSEPAKSHSCGRFLCAHALTFLVCSLGGRAGCRAGGSALLQGPHELQRHAIEDDGLTVHVRSTNSQVAPDEYHSPSEKEREQESDGANPHAYGCDGSWLDFLT